MSKQFFMVVAAVAVFSLALSDTTNAQVAAFGYPAGGVPCATGACGGGGGALTAAAQQRSFGYGQLSERFHATQAQNEKIYARNAAWPKPFACASRQHYHNIWRPMYDAGWEDQCILTSVHFDQEGELTRYGKNQISGIMMNMPRSRRTIFVQELANSQETNARIAKVQNVIQTWFSQRGGMVQASARTAVTLPGAVAESITERAANAAPAPTIPVAEGGTVATAVTQ